MRYRIWYQFKRGDKIVREDSGYVETADSAEQAVERARARGAGWGLGYDPNTLQCLALPNTHYHADMHGESTAFGVFPCSVCGGSCCDECSFKGVCQHC